MISIHAHVARSCVLQWNQVISIHARCTAHVVHAHAAQAPKSDAHVMCSGELRHTFADEAPHKRRLCVWRTYGACISGPRECSSSATCVRCTYSMHVRRTYVARVSAHARSHARAACVWSPCTPRTSSLSARSHVAHARPLVGTPTGVVSHPRAPLPHRRRPVNFSSLTPPGGA